jgi:hypothetical protein
MQIFRRCMARYHFRTLYQVAVVSVPPQKFMQPPSCYYEIYENYTVTLEWCLVTARMLRTTKINRLLRNLKRGCMWARMRAHVHTHTHTHARVRAHTHTRIHTHTHAHTQNADLLKLLLFKRKEIRLRNMRKKESIY